jgi:short-subunit dehydrogenase
MNKTAVITGASSGIGKALAFQLKDSYSSLFLCGRNMEEMQLVQQLISSESNQVYCIEMDLMQEESIRKAAAEIQNISSEIHLLINNAGVSQRAFAADVDFEVEKKVFQINYFGPVLLTKLLLPNLRAAKKSQIAITSSIVGKFGFPLRSTYSAAKHALHGYFESLRLEEAKNGISVNLMVVGRAQTAVSKNALLSDGEKYKKMDQGQEKGITAEECAKRIVKALKKNKKEVLIGGIETWMVYFKKFFPSLFYKIAKKEATHV